LLRAALLEDLAGVALALAAALRLVGLAVPSAATAANGSATAVINVINPRIIADTEICIFFATTTP
jgi:hypothetical protein